MTKLSVIKSNPGACDCCNKPLESGLGFGQFSWSQREYGFGSLPFVTCGECQERDLAAREAGTVEGRIDTVSSIMNRAGRHSKAWASKCWQMMQAESAVDQAVR